LLWTATDRGEPGRDPQYGWGVLNPLDALTKEPRELAHASGKGLPFTDIPRSAKRPPLWAGLLVIVPVAALCCAGVVLYRRRRRKRRPAAGGTGSS
jgi:hypothetical protein